MPIRTNEIIRQSMLWRMIYSYEYTTIDTNEFVLVCAHPKGHLLSSVTNAIARDCVNFLCVTV